MGWLLWRSRQLPRALALLLTLGGVGYLGHALLFLLVPDLADPIGMMLAVLGFGELALALWLAIKGLRPPMFEGAGGAGPATQRAMTTAQEAEL